MIKKLEKTLFEIFGDQLDVNLGTKIGDVKDIKNVGAVGVRDNDSVCSTCGEMPIEGSCGCNHSVDEDGNVCSGCGMMIINGECGCEHQEESEEVCPACGQLAPQIDSSCPCGISEGTTGVCKQCGMNEMTCECGMNEAELDEVAPEGYEDIVKALKKEPEVDNPWAVAWSMKKKGIEPKK